MSDLFAKLESAARETGCIDPYYVWAVVTGRIVEPAYPFLVERRYSTPEGQRVEIRSERLKVGDDGSIVFDDRGTVLSWQLGLRRNTSDIKLEDHERIDGRETAHVVAAVLDDGCPFLGDVFQREQKACVRWLWHQDKSGSLRTGATLAATPRSPKWYEPYRGPLNEPSYGAELAPHDIDAAVSLGNRAGNRLAAEQAIYAALNYLATPEKRKHGASVMSQVLAANASAPREHIPLIFVQFPERELADTAGGWLCTRVVDGLQYVLARAGEAFKLPAGEGNGPVPIVATVAYGGLAGAHDGKSLLERAMDELQDENPHLTIVLAAGNAYGRGVHASTMARPDRPAQLRLFIGPDNPNTAFAELWLQGVSDLDGTEITLLAPDGRRVCSVAGAGVAHSGAPDGVTLVAVNRAPQGQLGAMALVAIESTRIGGKRAARSAVGVWTIHVATRADIAIEAWVERDDISGAIARPQQTRFIGAEVNEDSTLSSIANGTHTRRFVVGSVVAADDSVSAYSASGPALSPFNARGGPDLSAPGDEAHSIAGLPCTGIRSGHRYRATGTSVAAGVAAASQIAQYLDRSPPDDGLVQRPIAVRDKRRGTPLALPKRPASVDAKA